MRLSEETFEDVDAQLAVVNRIAANKTVVVNSSNPIAHRDQEVPRVSPVRRVLLVSRECPEFPDRQVVRLESREFPESRACLVCPVLRV